MNKCVPMEVWDSEDDIDKLISQYDDTSMPLPDIEFQPHLLISKVRKHYMEYVIKMLSLNYETNQRLLNKNIYLPSAIWRCAKNLEMSAAQTCMVVQLYRKNMTQVVSKFINTQLYKEQLEIISETIMSGVVQEMETKIKDLKRDTTKGKLNKKLYDCLRNPPMNEKKIQVTIDRSKGCSCKCSCSRRKRPRLSESPLMSTDKLKSTLSIECLNTPKPTMPAPVKPVVPQIIPVLNNLNQPKFISSEVPRMSVESQDSDDVMSKMEKIFEGLPNDDDIFEGTFCDSYDFLTHEDNAKKIQTVPDSLHQIIPEKQDTIIENQAAQIKSLDERLASLTGMLANNNECVIQQKPEMKQKKKSPSKWLCEEYFLKVKLHEQLDLIRDTNRKKLLRIKQFISELFGEDSDDEDVVSPLDETQDFIVSCKERIAPWVVNLLTPCYIQKRINGKALFKSLAKHLLRIIYQCSHYPSEYEVQSFINDFLENHETIECEEDFKQFKIDNLATN